MAERILRTIVSLFIGIYIARYLGPEKFGQLSYALSFVGLFLALSHLGLNDIVVKALVKNETEYARILGTALILRLVAAFVTLGLIASALYFINVSRNEAILIGIIAASLVFEIATTTEAFFQAKVLSKYVVYAKLTQLFVSTVAKIALLAFHAELIWFAAVIVLDSIVLAVSLIYSFKKQGYQLILLKFDTSTATQLLRESWPLILSGLAVSLYMKIDQVMINEFLGAEKVGIYSAAVKISEAWYFIPAVISASVFPAILRAKDNKQTFSIRLQQFYDLMVWISLLIIVPVYFFGSDLVTFLFGDAYTEAGPILTVHIWALAFVSLGVASGKWMIAEGFTSYSMSRTIIGAISNILLNIVLIPMYGMMGAAISTLISQVIAAFLFDFFVKPLRTQIKIKLKALFFFSIFNRMINPVIFRA